MSTLPGPTKGQLALLWAAGLAAITLTASGEYALYVACGFGQWCSAAGPVCVDAYVLAAIHARREVPFAVLVMVGTNATAHLLPEAGPPVAVVVAVAALAPVVLWRVHALAAGSIRQADGTLPAPANRSDTATVDEPVFEVDLKNLDAWSAPWEGEPWPPTVGSAPTVAALASPAVVAQQATTGLAVVGLAPTTGAKVIDERAAAAVDTPAGDQSGYQGGDHRIELEPVIPVVAEVVTSPADDEAAAGRQDEPGGDHPHAGTVATLDEAAIDVRQAARELNIKTVQATGRPVTVATLQTEYGLSRRVATELRRYLVAAG